MIEGFPGPGGGLGKCVVCGESFVQEVILMTPIPVICIPGLEKDGEDVDLAVHGKCREVLENIRGTGWENLPAGPLRDIYAKAEADAGDPDDD